MALKALSALSAWVICIVLPATCSTSAGRLRKAMLRPTESNIGKAKIQKTASGSRKKRRNRTTVSWNRELWDSLLIAQIPPSERNEDIFQRSRMRPELGQI